jgi:hypothetical protein
VEFGNKHTGFQVIEMLRNFPVSFFDSCFLWFLYPSFKGQSEGAGVVIKSLDEFRINAQLPSSKDEKQKEKRRV